MSHNLKTLFNQYKKVWDRKNSLPVEILSTDKKLSDNSGFAKTSISCVWQSYLGPQMSILENA